MKAVRFALEEGFNPFEYEQKAFLEFQQSASSDPFKNWTYTEAANYFMQEWEQRGLEPATLTKMRRAIEMLTVYFTKVNLAARSCKNYHPRSCQGRAEGHRLGPAYTVEAVMRTLSGIPERRIADCKEAFPL